MARPPPSAAVAAIGLPDPAATLRLGRALGRHLKAGDVLALTGELGAGKTLLVRGLAQGLGVDDPEAVASPTYLLVIEHEGPVPLRHADAYLPTKLEGFLRDGGLDYLFDGRALVAIEWADRVAGAVPERALWLQLEVTEAGGRTARFRAQSPEAFAWVAGLADNDEP